MRRYLLLIILFISVSSTAATDKTKLEKSWHFYGIGGSKKASNTKPRLTDKEATAQVEAIAKKYKAAVDRALLEPSYANIIEAQQLHLKITNMALTFERKWKDSMILNMDKFEDPNEPTASYGLLYKAEVNKKEYRAVIDGINKSGGLVYVYRGTCPYCQKFAPIIRNFSELNHIQIRAVSCDGVISPEFPSSIKGSEASCTKLGATKVPAVMAALPNQNKLQFVSVGMASHEVLKQNLISLVKIFKGGRT